MEKLLYQQNKTMEILARQPIFIQNGGEYGEIRDIVIPHFIYLRIMLYSAELKRGTA